MIEARGNVPRRAHTHDAGADLRAANVGTITIQPGKYEVIPTGTRINLPEAHVGFVCSRSGLAVNHGLTVLNAPGVVDTGYDGEILVALINHGDEPVQITNGMRIAQLVVAPINVSNYEAVPEFSVRYGERGDNGFGSTGTHG